MKPPLFELERFFAAQEEAHAPSCRYMLCATGPEPLTLADLLGFMDGSERAAWEKLSLGYGETRGNTALREAIARLYSRVSPEEVLVQNGSAEGIFNLFNGLFQPGDHLIVQFPTYPSLYKVAQGIGCQVSHWDGIYQEGEWKWDVQRLARLMRTETKAIVTNFPHNPTGSTISQKDWASVIGIASDAGIYLIADEVYRYLEHTPEIRLSAAADAYAKGISIGSLSKAFGLPGLRIGWIATRDALARKRVSEMRDYTTICQSGPSEFLAGIALENREAIFRRNLVEIQENRKILERFLDEYGSFIQARAPLAGTTCFPKILSPQWSGERFCDTLLERDGILLLPGRYYDGWDAHFRLGFGKRDFAESLSAFRKGLERVLQE